MFSEQLVKLFKDYFISFVAFCLGVFVDYPWLINEIMIFIGVLNVIIIFAERAINAYFEQKHALEVEQFKNFQLANRDFKQKTPFTVEN